MAANILGLGFVTVSDLKSIMAAKIRFQTVIKSTFYAVFVGQFCIFAHFISLFKELIVRQHEAAQNRYTDYQP
jgi:hypothetical protein